MNPQARPAEGIFIVRIRRMIERVDAFLIAPNASVQERMLGYGAGVFGAAFAATVSVGGSFAFVQVAVLVTIGFDLFGGVVVNATNAGSSRFHHSNNTRWQPLGFVLAHVHPFILALVFPGFSWRLAVLSYFGIALATVLVLASPSALRAAVAFGATAILISATLAFSDVNGAIVWVIPVLAIKLLLAHLLPHAQRTKRP